MLKKVNGETWACCSQCGQKLQRLTDQSILIGVPLYCKKCKREEEFNIIKLKDIAKAMRA